MNETIETTDLFRSAFFLCMGFEFQEIRIAHNNKQLASFMFTGTDLVRHDKDYLNGHALVNPVQFREALNHLRDVMFKKLREQRGYRYDRKRYYRSHQNQY